MAHRSGMPVSVQRALGFTPRAAPETVVCGCGAEKRFDFNAIGQMIEICPRCRTQRLYRAIRLYEQPEAEDSRE